MASRMLLLLTKENKATGYIIIQLNNNLTTSAFIDLMEKVGNQSTHKNDSINRDKLDIINTFLKLKRYINKINDSTYDIKIDIDITHDLTYQNLFDLHECVEKLGERQRANDPNLEKCETLDEVINYFTEINKIIHKLEGSLHGPEWLIATFGARVGTPEYKIAPLKYKMLQEATFGYKRNRLYLDYCETGKNMRHVYEQNDVETLRRKMVQPQRNIHPSIFLCLHQDMALDYENYKKWCIENNSEELGYDYEHPMWWGTWELGHILTSSFNQSKFPDYDNIKIKIS